MNRQKITYALVIVFLAFLAVSSFILSNTGANQNQSRQAQEVLTSAPITLTNFDKSILGTRLDPSKLKTQPIHADFAVFINNEQVDFNNPEYFLKSAFMHVERDDDGSDGKKLHMHSTNVPLWVFFESIGMNFNRNCITLDNGENFCGTDKMKFFVNGQENDEYENYVFEDGDKILISFNSSSIVRELALVTDFSRI